MLHYASPPVVGGVESTIAHHAWGLAERDYTVRVISGSGAPFDPRVQTHIDPLFSSKHPDILAAKQALDAGVVPGNFDTLVAAQTAALSEALKDCDVCIVHNVHTMNKNLVLTAALAALSSPRLIAWCHDIAAANPQYLAELHPGAPWDLLRCAWTNTRYITISATRQAELAALFGLAPETIPVIPPGVDPARFFRWTPTTAMLVARLGLLDAHGILLLPARLTRRKNIALALRVLAALRARGDDYRLIVTGPPGPHNPANPGYLGELLEERRALGLEGAAHFLYELDNPPLIPNDDTVADLYRLADALFFPSIQEGFGIPVLEAGLAGLPVFCADIPAFRAVGGADVIYFALNAPAEAIADSVLDALTASPAARLRARTRREYRWDAIIQHQIIPLLEE
jgi:glycosyltransferase involved in cell wall biosynthesis